MPTVDCETSEEYFYDSEQFLASKHQRIHLRTVAPIANAHIFCASCDSCMCSRMCSGAKNFRCIELLFLYFASVVGVLTRKWGTWNQNEMVDLWKNPGRRSASACTTKKQTSTPAPDNKWNRESSAGGTKLTWREGRRIVELGVLAKQICFSEDIWKATIWKDHASVNLSVKFSSTSLPLPRYCKLRIW